MNPQSLNRHAYVHNSPLSMIDPTGLDCVYVNDYETQATVQSGDCTSDTDNGIYVNGKVDPNSFSLTPGNNGNSLAFNYTNDDTGMSTLFQTGLPTLCVQNSCAPWNLVNSTDALNPFAQGVFSQLNAMPIARFIGTVYGASALTGAAGAATNAAAPQLAALLQEYGPQALAKVGALGGLGYQLGQRLLYDPQVETFLSDVILGVTPGTAPPAAWTGFGVALATNWQKIVQAGQQIYQKVKGSVPH